MKRYNKRITIFLLITIAFVIGSGIALKQYHSFAMPVLQKDITLIDLEELNNGNMPEILYDDKTEIPKFINGKFTNSTINDGQEAVESLNSLKTLMKFSNPAEEFKYVTSCDSTNSRTFRLQQVYNGIPVYGNQLIISTNKSGDTRSLGGNYEPGINIDITPQITREVAENTVLRKRESDKIKIDNTVLVIYLDAKGKLCLAWEVGISGLNDKGNPVKEVVFVDANLNIIIASEQKIYYEAIHAKGYDGFSKEREFTVNKLSDNNYEMFDPKRNIKTFLFGASSYPISSRDNKWTDQAAVSAQVNLAIVKDYYSNILNPNYSEFQGKEASAFVHVSEMNGAMDNAFYLNHGLYFGDGLKTTKPLSLGLDVVAHEYTHGVIEDTAGLIYQNQSGALNEGYADILGNFIENDNDPQWLIGEDIMLPGQRVALRSMSNPAAYKQPSSLSNYVYTLEDNGGVHSNSSIINRAAFLMWSNGISSKETLARLWYGSLLKLNNKAGFLECRYAVMAAAKDLDMSTEELKIIDDAFKKVGIIAMKVDNSHKQLASSRLYPARIDNHEVWTPSEGKAKWGLIDEHGNFVVQPTYDLIRDFQPNGLAIVEIDALSGIIDRNGNEVLPVQYQSIAEFSEGYAVVTRNDQSIVLDENLNIHATISGGVSAFKEGLASINIQSDQTSKMGFINSSGEVVIEPKYSKVYPFSNGRSVVCDASSNFFIIDKSGKVLVDLSKYNIYEIDDELISYALKGTEDKGYMDYSGNVIIPAQYYMTEAFRDGYAKVVLKYQGYPDKSAIINKKGEYIIQPMSGIINHLGKGLFRVAKEIPPMGNSDYYSANALFDSMGKQLTEYKYYDFVENNDGNFSVTDGKSTYFIDRNGNQQLNMLILNGVGQMTNIGNMLKTEVDGVISYYNKQGILIWQEVTKQKLSKDIVVIKQTLRSNYFDYVKYPEILGINDPNIGTQMNQKLKDIFLNKMSGHLENTTNKSTFHIDYAVTLQNDLLSFKLIEKTYNLGGAQGAAGWNFYHFNINNGQIYKLRDLFKSGAKYEDMLSSVIRKQLVTVMKDLQNNQNIISINGESTMFDISTEGINVYFPQNEFGSYTSGHQKIFVKFSDMQDMVDKEGKFWQTIFNK